MKQRYSYIGSDSILIPGLITEILLSREGISPNAFRQATLYRPWMRHQFDNFKEMSKQMVFYRAKVDEDIFYCACRKVGGREQLFVWA